LDHGGAGDAGTDDRPGALGQRQPDEGGDPGGPSALAHGERPGQGDVDADEDEAGEEPAASRSRYAGEAAVHRLIVPADGGGGQDPGTDHDQDGGAGEEPGPFDGAEDEELRGQGGPRRAATAGVLVHAHG